MYSELLHSVVVYVELVYSVVVYSELVYSVVLYMWSPETEVIISRGKRHLCYSIVRIRFLFAYLSKGRHYTSNTNKYVNKYCRLCVIR